MQVTGEDSATAERARELLGSCLSSTSEDQYTLCTQIIFKSSLEHIDGSYVTKIAGMQQTGELFVQNVLLAAKLLEYAADVKHDARAMHLLANIYMYGAQGIPADGARSVSLYQRAIDEECNVVAMKNLAYLLHQEPAALPADGGRAVRLYERAIDEGGLVIAMGNFANLLRKGAADVPADGARAVRLYKRAIDEGSM